MKWVWPKQQPSGKGSIHAVYASVDACKAAFVTGHGVCMFPHVHFWNLHSSVTAG